MTLAGFLLAGVAATPAHAETVRAQQWHLTSMRADDIWETSTGKGVTVAVIDTGVGRIPELEGQVLPGKDFATQDAGDERADYGKHGTTMAALIAATGRHPSGDGSFGLAPGAKILPIRVPHESRETAPSWTEAIRYAADSDAKIISISLGMSKDDPARLDAVKYALSKGRLIFSSVGNEGASTNDVLYPAATPGVVGVGAVDRDGKVTAESQHGPQVDLVAPGVDIVTACASDTQLCKNHGTSDATALASASAALLWSAHPDWTNNQVLRVMMKTAGKPTDGAERSDFVGYGIVRPRIAVTTPGDPGPADVYPLPDLAAAGGGSGAKGSPAASSDGKTPAPRAEVKKDDGSGLPWLALGLGACLVIGGAVAAVGVRRRNR
ncbi:type VII secretion-associated serine protease mycosin [Streptomyces sp. ISL-43]|uniref:type VII secretion-associated serine protease mycosin n=1 Tax=Streptomyces sp. ISL-43 TaxID=2819183 RepID=UPI0027E3E310|nr:type VII secretion-associated serine protease mycosin [Streptomyces sp. ISL-43]